MGATAHGGVGAGVRGRTARIRAPCSPTGGVTAAMDPPCSSQTQLAMASPMPVPPPASSPEPKRSKTCWARSAGMPLPSSATMSHQRSGPSGPALTVTRPPDGLCRSALSSRLARTCSRRAGVRGDVQVGGYVDDVDGAAPGDSGLRHGALDEGSDVDRGEVEGRAAAVDPAEVEQVTDEGPEPFGLGQGGPQHGVVRTHDPVDEVLEQRLLGGERGAQLVRHGRHELRGAAGRRRRGRPPSC